MSRLSLSDQGLRLMVPLKPDLSHCGLPPLPRIRSEEIETHVFTHRSLTARFTTVFEDTPKYPSLDNELLEHVGDQVLGLLVTDLLQREYPNLRAGPSTAMRELVLNNATLASIAVQYNLPDRLRVRFTIFRKSKHVQADVFESYVGGLYKDQGLGAVEVWLDQLFTPYVHEAFRMVREQHDSKPVGFNYPAVPPNSPVVPINSPVVPIKSAMLTPLGQFNVCLQPYNKQVKWIFSDTITENNVPLWTVKLFVDGDCWGYGHGSSKKAAKVEAAKQGHKKIGVGCGCEEHTFIISEG